MNCAECKENLVAYIEELLDEAQKQAVTSHLENCPKCQAETDELAGLRDRLVANGKALARRDLENKVMDRIIREQSLKLKKANKLNKQLQLWRIIMRSKITKLATAAVIILVVVLSITFLDKAVAPAYAIEQTIEANHTVRYIHIKDFKVDEDEPKEFWFECDDFGQIKNARWHMPEWDSPADGAKVVVWKEGKATVWFKKKKSMLTVAEQKFIDQMSKFIEANDPRKIVEHLDFLQTKGKVKIEIDEPSDKSEPIVVTVIYLPESPSGRREVLFVDQATKLVMAIEYYQLKNGEYEHRGTMEFYDYNQPIEAEMFSLDDEVPADVTRVDHTTQEVGMAQGELSDEEIAVEVAHQFFEALIAKDYDKAGKLLAGIPGNRIQQMFGNISFLRIISIGSPAPHPNPRNEGCLIVPSVVEIEKNGEISEWKLDRLGVGQAVHNQPGRWIVFDGIDPKTLEPNIPNDNKLIEEHKSPSVEQKSGRELTDEEKNQQPMVKEVARKLFQACSDNDWDKFSKLWPDLELKDFQKNYLGGLEIGCIDEPFKKDDSDTWYVPYEIKLKVGEVRKKDLRVRYDESTAEFKACGGL